MSFVKLLNNAILEVPILEVKLEKSIKEQDWDEQEKEYLIQIVRQLKEPKLCKSNKLSKGIIASSEPLTLEINFKSDNLDINKIYKYFEKLIKDLNKVSKEIKFELSNFCKYSLKDTWSIKIDWYI